MDLIVILVIALVFCLRNNEAETQEEQILEQYDYEVLKRETKLNPQFYDDANAFRRIVNELGFR